MGFSQLSLNKTTEARGNVCFPTGYESTENVLTVALQGSSQLKTIHWSNELTEPCYHPLFPQAELSSLLKVLGVWNFWAFFFLPDKQVDFCLLKGMSFCLLPQTSPHLRQKPLRRLHIRAASTAWHLVTVTHASEAAAASGDSALEQWVTQLAPAESNGNSSSDIEAKSEGETGPDRLGTTSAQLSNPHQDFSSSKGSSFGTLRRASQHLKPCHFALMSPWLKCINSSGSKNCNPWLFSLLNTLRARVYFSARS